MYTARPWVQQVCPVLFRVKIYYESELINRGNIIGVVVVCHLTAVQGVKQVCVVMLIWSHDSEYMSHDLQCDR